MDWLNQQLFIQKLGSPLSFIVLLGLAVFVSLVIVFLGIEFGVALFGLSLALPMMILCLINIRLGIAFSLIAAFFINFLSKYTSAPVGLMMDGLLALLIFSALVQISLKRDWEFPKNPISIIILVWIVYNVILVLNPEAASKVAWAFTVRSLAILQLLFFLACYAIRSFEHIKFLLKLVIGLGLVSALYGIKQEFFGYSNQEWAWLYQSPTRYQLIVQWNRYRAFSLFSDPTTFGTLMAYLGTFCMVLATGPFATKKRIALIIGGILMYMAMAYAGSRTPFILIPSAILIYALLNINKNVIIGTGLFFMIGTAFIMKSTTSPVIYRIQSAFKPGKDASVQVRLQNQKLIQPYIQKHPFGAGLGSTGIWGERFSPDSWLAGFAHDSAYIRVAVEMGWLGLIIYLSTFFIAMRMAVYYYHRVQNPKIKVCYLGFAIIIFMLALASYPQEVVTLLPNNVVFYILLAIIVKLKDFDTVPKTDSL